MRECQLWFDAVGASHAAAIKPLSKLGFIPMRKLQTSRTCAPSDWDPHWTRVPFLQVAFCMCAHVPMSIYCPRSLVIRGQKGRGGEKILSRDSKKEPLEIFFPQLSPPFLLQLISPYHPIHNQQRVNIDNPIYISDYVFRDTLTQDYEDMWAAQFLSDLSPPPPDNSPLQVLLARHVQTFYIGVVSSPG